MNKKMQSMNEYTQENTLLLAKRWQNSKRSYLLVNPLQAKHLPAPPGAALQMMRSLGRQTAAHYPQARLVIGFAETATAIGAAVADCLAADCIYLQTTRENEPTVEKWLDFQEEHSHAVEQQLCADTLAAAVAASPQIIFVDDEISTGQTLLNIIEQLKRACPEAAGREMVAASIINRLQPVNERRWAGAGLRSEYLVRPTPVDYDKAVAGFAVSAAETAALDANVSNYVVLQPEAPYLNTRLGVKMREYQQNCRQNAVYLAALLARQIDRNSRILLLGTEEFMYPAIILGDELERQGWTGEVRCQATTRSPIGICAAEGYPIHSGYQLHSFYAEERRTFIYNLAAYDAAVILSDTSNRPAESLALADLLSALRAQGCRQLFYVRGGRDV